VRGFGEVEKVRVWRGEEVWRGREEGEGLER
jgi:hypothetical protein